ncbi:M23 family metallopeptidase [Streptomyces sp. NPDC051940]|uniref:M23 family metallopeptidase n=1 Tax=Streptomyces sp. NPDC051940 TaxID=3155675 RepID=UPI00342A7605
MSTRAAGFHTGVDFGVGTGTPVLAVGPGTVVTSAFDGSYGNYVVIRMTDGHYALYAHLSERAVAQGASVAGGQRIGLSGATGNVTGLHLHFEARSTN